jgi:hypothetical protein
MRRSRISAVNRIAVILASSDGWMPRPPRLNQHADQQQTDQGDHAPDERVIPIGAVVDPHRDRQHRHTEDGPQRLLVQEVIGLIEALLRDDG